MKEQDVTPTVVSESNEYLNSSLNTSSQLFNPKSFLFGGKSSNSSFEKATPNVALSGSKTIFGNVSTDSTKTDDIKSTSLFNLSSTTTPNSSIFGTFSTAGSFSTTGATETQNTTQGSLFSKTDDIKSKTDSLFNFSPKPDSLFKFGVASKDPKSIFGQNLFGNKDKTIDENISKGIYIFQIK